MDPDTSTREDPIRAHRSNIELNLISNRVVIEETNCIQLNNRLINNELLLQEYLIIKRIRNKMVNLA